jgi:ubiquinone/menaquinone biosynthesis C-methylase UbiE
MQTTRQNDNTFDDLAEAYDRFRTGYSATLYDVLFTLGFRPGAHVLDAGCGTGIAMAQFAARGCAVTGVDPSPAMLAAAAKNVPAATLHEGRVEQLPFANGAFDGVVCAQAFHWFDQPAAFNELSRVVKRGSPIAVWWKRLASTDRMRAMRAAACADVRVSPAESFQGGFRSFYAAPFANRVLRVLPFTTRTTRDQWLGYERSRASARNAYGTKRDAYFDALEGRLNAAFGTSTSSIEVQYMQYLYVGYP